jgi:ATP-binding cassette subfamily F protein 3
VANKIWYIEQHEIKEYPGTYEEYEFWRSQQVAQVAAAPVQKPIKTTVMTPSKSKEETQLAKKELKKLEDQLQSIEKEIHQLEVQKVDLEAKLAEPSLYLDEAQAQKTQASYQQVQSSLEKVNATWEQLVDQISTLQQQVTPI